MKGINMLFIIDKEIYFRPADGAIWGAGTENEKRFLTLAGSRLLLFFIEHRGEIVTRDAIFQAVWERYGLHSTNNTLNQYISLLRRTMTDFGLGAQVIKTIPKTGFIFSRDLSVIALTEQHDVTAPAPIPAPIPAAPDPLIARKQYGALALLVLFLLCAFMLFGLWQSRTLSAPLPEFGKSVVTFTQCDFMPAESEEESRLLASSDKLKFMTLVDDLAVEQEPTRDKTPLACPVNSPAG
ncbi:winged helix-turn-helix domain-containing protein [Kosakonia cowanii]|uniref:winged helix-turn-helix domain-containing protein n=1 Tax=Kosakonia cowanii TaxID=208223 RepID=UPI001F59EDD0|nr:winged helix-turn-helix domain-containing protein [Kosakonia cowanii]